MFVDLEKLKQQIAEQSINLIDVREQGEWDDGHVREAVHVPLSELRSGIIPEGIDKSKPSYLYCRSGQRVFFAAPILENAGFSVTPMQQGFEELIEYGFHFAE